MTLFGVPHRIEIFEYTETTSRTALAQSKTDS